MVTNASNAVINGNLERKVTRNRRYAQLVIRPGGTYLLLMLPANEKRLKTRKREAENDAERGKH